MNLWVLEIVMLLYCKFRIDKCYSTTTTIRNHLPQELVGHHHVSHKPNRSLPTKPFFTNHTNITSKTKQLVRKFCTLTEAFEVYIFIISSNVLQISIFVQLTDSKIENVDLPSQLRFCSLWLDIWL